MESLYSAPQPFAMYEQPHWVGDSKPPFVGDGQDPTLTDKTLDATPPVHSMPTSESRRPSMLKVEDDFSTSAASTGAATSHRWHDRAQDVHPPRSFSASHASMMNGTTQPFMRMNDPAFSGNLQHSQTWSIPHSGASTPTPLYNQVYDMSYAHAAPGFSAFTNDPATAISMSPQSSQGGWASAASSDGTEQRGMISPTYRATSPGTVMRPDGIRKKNARFEIPKERNLANIDAMIIASTDESEKKELKQQKRLLRNRQAALDSRQRKKTHTEKLEQEKKLSDKRMVDMEETLTRLENTIAMERDSFLQQRQHMETFILSLQYERDEAIRTKTLETAELRRQNIMLKDCVRELEGQQNKLYATAAHVNHYPGDFDYRLDNSWDDEFDLIDSDDLKMDDPETQHGQSTPKPMPAVTKQVDVKAEAGFSWSTFYMCLLFGAFIASNGNNKNVDNGAASAIASSISSTEASNVLKTVLSSGNVAPDHLPTHAEPTNAAAVDAMNNIHPSHLDVNVGPPSTLDHLHQSLAGPTRRQEMAAAFSMSASSYQHLTDPFNEHVNLNVDPTHELLEPTPPQPTALQKAFASMQAQKDNLDRLTGMGSKARERSLLWDQVPPEVIKNFEAMVQKSTNNNGNGNNAETMEP